MNFKELDIPGLYLIDLEVIEDGRGHFMRTWCEREAREAGVTTDVRQSNSSYSRTKGTIRGLHYQVVPAAEDKLIRVVRGAIFDAVIDLRQSSSTYLQSYTAELSHDQPSMLYVPKGLAHGFQTLSDDTEVVYQVSEFHSPEHEAGIRYDDPLFAIAWPLPVSAISKKDSAWPDYQPETK